MLFTVSSALCWSFFHQLSELVQLPPAIGDKSSCERFVLAQILNMPDYLRLAFGVLAIFLHLLCLFMERGLFTRVHPEARERVLAFWKKIPGPGREFLLFYNTLVAFFLFSFLEKKKDA